MTDRQEEWVLVPKKPTLEMSRAVREETRFCDPVGIYQKMIAAAPTHPAITHCESCGCDWLDNGLNPIGCPYCKQSNTDSVRALVGQWRDAAKFFTGDAGSDIRETLMACARELESALAQQPAAVDGLAARLVAELDGLVGESYGVSGLHLNGDAAPWDELLPGGRFERLSSLDELRAALAAQQQGGRTDG